MVADGCPRFHAGCRMVVMVAGLMVAGWLPTPLGNHAECHALGANRTRRDSPNDANDPGCVKTRNKITCAPQKNRTRGPGEFVMYPRTLTHINVAPEPCRKLFHTTKTLNRHRLVKVFGCRPVHDVAAEVRRRPG